MTTLTLEQTKKEKKGATSAKWQAANPEKVKAIKVKYRAANPGVNIISKIGRKYKAPLSELRQIIPQELVDVKIIQLTLRRLIKEKGLINEPARI
jgi:hypothetical protein